MSLHVTFSAPAMMSADPSLVAATPASWIATLLAVLIGAFLGAVIGGYVAYLIACRVSSRTERSFATEQAGLLAARNLMAEIRDYLRCARSLHPQYEAAQQRRLELQTFDLIAAFELERPALDATTAGTMRAGLDSVLSTALAVARSYERSRAALVDQLSVRPATADRVVRVGMRQLVELERWMGSVTARLGTYRSGGDRLMPLEPGPNFRSISTAEALTPNGDRPQPVGPEPDSSPSMAVSGNGEPSWYSMSGPDEARRDQDGW